MQQLPELKERMIVEAVAFVIFLAVCIAASKYVVNNHSHPLLKTPEANMPSPETGQVSDATAVQLKKDGTKYLALVEFNNKETDWMVVHWGTAVGLSDPSDTPGWISNLFKLRDPKFIKCYELDALVRSLEDN